VARTTSCWSLSDGRRRRSSSNAKTRAMSDTDARLTVAIAEIQRLRTIIAQMQAEAAIARGSLALPPQPDEPGAVTHDIQPNAPR
jgi:hypothetical protein